METIICNEYGCENEINPGTMQYGKDFYVLVNMTEAEEMDIQNITDVVESGLVGIYCKNCGMIILTEAVANGFQIVSRRQS